MGVVPGPQDFHLHQQQMHASKMASTAEREVQKLNQTAEKLERDWRKAVARGDRGRAMKLQKQLDRTTERSLKKGREARKYRKEEKQKKSRWW